MKKVFALILALSLTLTFFGCGQSASNKASGSSVKGVRDVISDAQQTTAAAQPTTVEDIKYPELDYEAELDLTDMGATMVFSEVSNMMTVPEQYEGKTVKASGMFDVYTDINTGNFYYACIIPDATACCSQGLEFLWKGDHTYPDDYPEVADRITIGGVFESYKEGDATYIRLRDAEISF